VADKIMNIGIYRQAKDLVEQLRPIANAIDRLQSDSATIADPTDAFLSLLHKPTLEHHKVAIQKRLDQAIDPCHLAAYMLHPRYQGEHLTATQKETAKTWLEQKDAAYLPTAIAFQAKAELFPPSFFTASATAMKAATWWKGIAASVTLPAGFAELMMQLHSATASSSSIERVFSSFGLIHTKLRNRLGIEKAQKLVFCYRMLRGAKELEY
jgi:hypothetical protein